MSRFHIWLDRLFGSAPETAFDEEAADVATVWRPPTLPTLAPPIHQAEQILADHARQIDESGALDEGGGHLFDEAIKSWVVQWGEGFDAEYESHLRQLILRQRRTELEISHHERRLDDLEREIREIDLDLKLIEDTKPLPRSPRWRQLRSVTKTDTSEHPPAEARQTVPVSRTRPADAEPSASDETLQPTAEEQ